MRRGGRIDSNARPIQQTPKREEGGQRPAQAVILGEALENDGGDDPLALGEQRLSEACDGVCAAAHQQPAGNDEERGREARGGPREVVLGVQCGVERERVEAQGRRVGADNDQSDGAARVWAAAAGGRAAGRAGQEERRSDAVVTTWVPRTASSRTFPRSRFKVLHAWQSNSPQSLRPYRRTYLNINSG
ncbi:hypothetical protein C8J57DRAFT_1212139 [Mycena rebaudengoi]|nr:hypothetical protein C8J57DRAFT_1212139 [Mycena rebaudengoi]